MRATARSTGPLLVAGITDLLADHYRFTSLDQLGEVGLERMKGDAGHLDWHVGRLAARSQGDVEQARRLLGIIVEKLVEIPHPVEQEGIRMVGLERQILAHHRRVP
jgi:hypothetical protein